MARTDTLPHFLTDVADAIREKGGTSEPIQASDFDTEIENLPSGGGADLSDYFEPTIDSDGFKKMIKTIPSSTIVSGTNLNNALSSYYGETIPLLDTSDVTTMSSMFSDCKNLITIPLLDTSNVTNMQTMFSGCSSLISIPQLNTENVATNGFSSTFSKCTNLTTIPILNTSKATNMNNMFYNCPNLTDTSIDNILQMCINSNTSVTSRKKLSYMGFNATNYPTSRIEALPHYQDFIDAGWTIGY